MRVRALVAVAGVLLAAGGCSGDSPAPEGTVSSAPSPGTTDAAPTATKPSAPGSSGPSSSASTVGLVECMSGSYRLARFVALKESAYGTGEGGDVTVTFDGGSYLMQGAGKRPYLITLAGTQAELVVDGTVSGALTTAGYQGTFTVGETTGQARLRQGVRQQVVPMSQVATVLAPDGPATLACTPKKLAMVFDDTRLEFER